MKKTDETKTESTQIVDKPWLNSDGSFKDDNELKALARNWNATTWEAYLADLNMAEELSSSRTDSTTGEDLDELFTTEDSLQSFISDLKVEYFPALGLALKQAMSVLSKQQREIVILHFWEGLSIQEVAEKLGVTKQSIFRQLNRAISKLRSEILKKLRPNRNEDAPSQGNSTCLTFEATKLRSSKT